MDKAGRVLAASTLLCLLVCVSVASAEQASERDQGAAKTGSTEDSAAPGYVFDVLNPQQDKPTAAPEGEAAVPPQYYVDVLRAQEAKDAAAELSSSPRHFFDIFYGPVTTVDTAVSAFSQDSCFIFCSNTTHSVSRTVHFERSAVFGLRIGGWLRSYPRIGLAADFSYLQANAPGVSIWYVPISFVVLGRYPFLSSDSMPDGRLQLYGGLMMSEVIGDIEVDFTPEMPRKVGGSSDRFNIGGGVLLGIAWRFSSFAFFSEFRMMKASLDSEESGLFGGSSSASADLETKQTVFGLSHRF
jgi:hypothetical protein